MPLASPPQHRQRPERWTGLYPLMKWFAGRPREIGGGSIVLAALCAIYNIFGLPH